MVNFLYLIPPIILDCRASNHKLEVTRLVKVVHNRCQIKMNVKRGLVNKCTPFLLFTLAFLILNPAFLIHFLEIVNMLKTNLKLSIIFGYLNNTQIRNFNFNLFHSLSYFFLPVSFWKVKVHLNLWSLIFAHFFLGNLPRNKLNFLGFK
jgi:hypothetical protein